MKIISYIRVKLDHLDQEDITKKNQSVEGKSVSIERTRRRRRRRNKIVISLKMVINQMLSGVNFGPIALPETNAPFIIRLNLVGRFQTVALVAIVFTFIHHVNFYHFAPDLIVPSLIRLSKHLPFVAVH